MERKDKTTWFFGALLVIVAFVAWLILAPYLGVFVLAGTLAFLFQPWYRSLARVLHHENLAAFAIVVLVTIIVFLPLTLLSLRMVGEATAFYNGIAAFNTLSISVYLQQGLTWLIQNIGSLFRSVAQIFFTAFLSLFGMFYLLKDGERLKLWLVKLIPLPAKYTEDIVREIEEVANSVVKGTLLVAVIQGIIMGIGLFIFRVPDATFLGAAAIMVSVIPILGTWLVAVPAVAYLFFVGHTALGVGLAIWSVVLINLIYNILTPRFMHQGVNLHPYLILLSILGGIGLFGPIGFLIGPLALTLLFSLLKTYKSFI